MTLPADIAHIEKLHQLAEANGDTSFEHHMRATLLRAYRELAQENERLTLERDEARGIKLAQLKAVVGERDRLRASHAKLQQLLERLDACLEPHALAGVSRDPEDLQVRASHAQEFWCALMDVRTALADAQHPDPEYQSIDAAGNPVKP